MAEAQERRLNNLFFWDCVVIKVEDEYFRVPRNDFVKSSEFFAGMFQVPPGNEECEGKDLDHPVVLEGYKKEDFVCLLKIMYPMTSDSDVSGEPMITKEELSKALKLASTWVMEKYRNAIIRRLSSSEFSLSPIDKMLFARDHCISKWFEESIMTLADPEDQTRSIEELSKLGWETAARVATLNIHCSKELVATRRVFQFDTLTCWGTSQADCSGPADCLIPNQTHTCPGCGFVATGSTTFPTNEEGDDNSRHAINGDKILCPGCSAPLFEGTIFICPHCNNPTENDKNMYYRLRRITAKDILPKMISTAFRQEIDQYGFIFPCPASS